MAKNKKQKEEPKEEPKKQTINEKFGKNLFMHNYPALGTLSSDTISAEEFEKIMSESYFERPKRPRGPERKGRGSAQYL